MTNTFSGGIHPPDSKGATAALAIQQIKPTQTLVISLRQSMGAASTPLVEKGQRVARGQPIGRPSGFISAALHAPTSGAVKKFTRMLDPVTGTMVEAIELEPDGEDRWHEDCNRERSWRDMTPDDLRRAVAEAGLVGLGGATFPTNVKLTPPKGATIDTVILNGAECEPYLTCDHRLMLSSAAEIVEGLEIFMQATAAPRGVVAIESNKMDAYQVLKDAAAELNNVEVVALEVKYPQGAEKQLIKSITGREVPSGGLPADAGVVVQNVGTAKAAWEALRWRRPLTERLLTITGDAVEKPGNFSVRLGTSVASLAEAAGLRDDVGKVICGGPMMGLALSSVETYTIKGFSGLLCLRSPQAFEHGPCIRCGNCVEACPAGLLPSTLSILGEAYEDNSLDALDQAMETGLMDCIECGSCSFVCPAGRRIVHYVRFLKGERRKKLARQREKKSQQQAAVSK
ncbi:MAG: electron transport complex subunit RsxC [Anaerolineaceae bacterium]|nr:electron transport complex subunit RsxC [Anaerolineaceae bacterium]